MRNISAWAIRHPLPPVVLFVVLLFMGIVAFIRLPVTLNPDVSFPGVIVSRRPAGGGAAGTGDPDPAEGRRGGCEHRQHQLHHLLGDRGAGQRLHRIQHRYAYRPGGRRRARRDGQGAGEPAAGDPGTGGAAHRRRRQLHRLLRGELELPQPGGAVLVRRQHHHQAAVVGPGRGAGEPRRRRQPRDPRGAGPGADAGARHHRRDCKRAAAHAQPRPRRRTRAGGRRRAGDPRARRRAHRGCARRIRRSRFPAGGLRAFRTSPT